MKTKSLPNFRNFVPIGFMLSLLLLSTCIQVTGAAPPVKNTIIWEHYFTDMKNPYDMSVKALEVSQETRRVYASVVYINGTAVYCLNSETGELIWRLDASIIYNETNYLIYVKSIVSDESLNAVYIGGVGINADNLSPQEIPRWFSDYPTVVFGFVISRL